MIQNKCDHEWTYRNDYTPFGGGQIQPMYGCNKCNILLPASNVFQLEALENQNETLKHLKGFEKYIAIAAVIMSFIALIISILK
jgi:hypothetical protein